MGKEHKPGARQVSEDIGAKDLHPTKTPGKRTEPQHGPTGDAYVDHGSFKDPKAFLAPDQRTRLTNAFQQRSLVAQSNYQDAASDVRVDKLLEKDEELHWMASMLIDLAFGFVIGQVAKSVIAFRNAKLDTVKSYLGDQAERIAMGFADDDELKLAQRVSLAFGKLSDDHIKTAVGAVGGLGKKLVTGKLDTARSNANKRKESLNYLDQLRNAAGIAFQKFREATPAFATDAELVALFHAMDIENHQIDAYKVAIEEKIKRFEDSEVAKIGRQWERRHDFYNGKPIGGWSERVIRDVWVEWHTFESGYPRELVFQYQDGKDNPDVIHWDEPDQVTKGQTYLGHTHRKRELRNPFDDPAGGTSNDPKSKYLVPDEFRETAITRHKQKWGTEPATVHIDDGDPLYFPADRAKKAQENKAKKATVPKQQLSR